MLLAFLAYKRQFTSRVSALVDKAFEMRLLRLHAERLADVVLTPPEERPLAGRLLETSGGALAPTLEIRALSFRYAEHEPYVLHGLDLAVAAGESVAIVGPSGCGKSTLLNIVLGTLAPTGGDVLIGGLPLAQLDHDLLRRTVASVVQNDCLFAGTIGENISFFDAHADRARIEECAQLAAIHAEITSLPMAYNTLVGFMGSTLSAGQQQRILLARALYARPSILILDEATSHLDVQREAAVCAALRKLAITRIVVAHRPQTAATADRIVRLEAGRLVPVASAPRGRFAPDERQAGSLEDERQRWQPEPCRASPSKTCSRTSDVERVRPTFARRHRVGGVPRARDHRRNGRRCFDWGFAARCAARFADAAGDRDANRSGVRGRVRGRRDRGVARYERLHGACAAHCTKVAERLANLGEPPGNESC